MPYGAALSAVFIFRSDAAQVNDRSRISHGHDLGEAPLRPFGIVVALFLVGRVGLGHCCHRDGSEQEHRRNGEGDRFHDNSSHVYAKERREPNDDITTTLFVRGPGFADLANRSEVREAFGVRCARDHAQPRQKSTGNDMHRALRLLAVLSGLGVDLHDSEEQAC